MSQPVNRRVFSQTAVTAATAVSLAPGRVLGASDQVRLGFIGVGNRGCQLLKGFLAQPDAKVVALCDVYEPYLNAAYDRLDPRFAGLGKRIPQMPKLEGDVARVKDFRTILDRKDIDAVVIATPDHWHAIQMISACKAGKDVYVEKPLSMTISRRPGDGRGGQQARPDRAGGHAPAFVADVRPARRGGSLRCDRQGHGGTRRLCQQHGPRGHRPCARIRAAGRPRLGPLAGPAAGPTVSVDDHAVQVPLVASLLVADRQLGRSLFRPDPLADRRAGAGIGLGARRAVRRR